MNRTALAIKMLIYLKANGLTKKQELADYLETNVRNIKELRSELETAGYLVEIIPGPYGGYRLIDTSFFPLAKLDEIQRKALVEASSYLLSSKQPYLNDQFKEAYRTLIANEQPSATIISADSIRLAMPIETLEQLLQELQKAISSRTRVMIDYQRNLTKSKLYEFEPYEIIQVNSLWYVLGYIKNDHWASLKVNRINSINHLEQTYLVDESYNVSQLLNEFGFKFNDVIRIDAIISNHSYVSEYIYGKFQKIEILDDVKLRISFEIDSQQRAKQFALQFGADIEIIEPLWLIEHQKSVAKKILNYD